MYTITKRWSDIMSIESSYETLVKLHKALDIIK